jgi:2-haloacid dehalogenase
MLEAAKPYHRIAFDDVISAAVAGTFKPHVRTYTKAAELARVRMEEVLFVANHAFDCIGAKSAGMRWIVTTVQGLQARGWLYEAKGSTRLAL